MSNFTSSQFLNLVDIIGVIISSVKVNSIVNIYFAHSIHQPIPKLWISTNCLACLLNHQRWMSNFEFRILNMCFDFLIYFFLVSCSWKRNVKRIKKKMCNIQLVITQLADEMPWTLFFLSFIFFLNKNFVISELVVGSGEQDNFHLQPLERGNLWQVSTHFLFESQQV